jgi:hypothetical protein
MLLIVENVMAWCLIKTPRRHMRVWMYSSTILDCGISWRWTVNFTPQQLYPSAMSPLYPSCRRLSTVLFCIDVVDFPGRLHSISLKWITLHTYSLTLIPFTFWNSEWQLDKVGRLPPDIPVHDTTNMKKNKIIFEILTVMNMKITML